MLLKFVPVAGSAISAGVAAGLTFALGEAYIRLCEEILRCQAAGEPDAVHGDACHAAGGVPATVKRKGG